MKLVKLALIFSIFTLSLVSCGNGGNDKDSSSGHGEGQSCETSFDCLLGLVCDTEKKSARTVQTAAAPKTATTAILTMTAIRMTAAIPSAILIQKIRTAARQAATALPEKHRNAPIRAHRKQKISALARLQ